MPPMEGGFRIRKADWRHDSDALRRVREAVFVVEQRVPPELEWDERDPECLHVLAETAAGQVIGTGRLLPDGHIGRMAVMPSWRSRGVGSALLMQLLSEAKQLGFTEVVLHAQVHAVPFYERHGFAAEGPEFADAGIPHRTMRRRL